MQLSLNSTIRLNNGVNIPRLGLGVFRAQRGPQTLRAVGAALAAGYRHIDTARVYGNEEDVGTAVRESGLARESVFVTTKLWNDDHGFDATLRAAEGSRARLGLGPIDLFLIHWPVPGRWPETWRAMERLLADGVCRAIGVSNFQRNHLDELQTRSNVTPAVDQIELSPFLYQKELLEHCRRTGIVVEAYSPLTKGLRLADRRLLEVARRYRKSTAQLLVRWALQHDVVVIPKSTHEERIHENGAVFDFEIADEDMTLLDALNENLRTGWDPSEVPAA